MPATISLAHGTLLELAPPDLVRVAADAGFDAVGLRVAPWLPNETAYAVLGNDKLLTATTEALARHGLVVLDIEVIRIEAGTHAADFRPIFEAGARLGARYVLAVAMDPDEARAAQRYAEVCAEAAPFGLRVVLEFMARGGIRTLDAACRVVAAAGRPDAGILVDAVHYYRSGAVADDVARLDPKLLPYMQICDVDRAAVVRRAEPPETAVWKKRLPGEGDLPLVDLLRALPAGIPVAIEAPAGHLPEPGASERYARRAFRSTRAAVDARGPAPRP